MRHIAAKCPAQTSFNPAPVQSRPLPADRDHVSLPAPGSHPGAADEPLITALVAEHCPACGARLAPSAQWCGLCFADLRPAPGPVGGAAPAPAAVSDALPSPRAETAPA